MLRDRQRRAKSFSAQTRLCFWGAQAASLQRLAACQTHFRSIHRVRCEHVRGKLPRTTGWQPVLPRRKATALPARGVVVSAVLGLRLTEVQLALALAQPASCPQVC